MSFELKKVYFLSLLKHSFSSNALFSQCSAANALSFERMIFNNYSPKIDPYLQFRA